jgi:hypothetical protein
MTTDNPEGRDLEREKRKDVVESSPITYRLHIKRGDQEIDVQGDKDFVQTRFDALAGQVLRGSPTTSERTLNSQSRLTEASKLPTAISEFLRRLKVDAHTDIVLGMGYYLLKVRNQALFTAAEISRLYDESRWPKTNINLAIIGNIRKGLMREGAEKRDGNKTFAVTPLGEEYIDKLFSQAPG